MLWEDNPLEYMLFWYEENINMLDQLTTLVRSPWLTSIQRRTVVALITQDVHYRDIVEDLKNSLVDDINNFKWQ